MTTKLALPFANKELGQHFLTNEKVIEEICNDYNQSTEDKPDAIIEIGPGPGILTEFLAKIDLPYTVIELDKRFKKYLLQYISEDQIILDDALKFDLEKFILDKGYSKVWIVSNLPYNISAPLIIKFSKISSIKTMTLMMQKEVGEKMRPKQGKKNTMSSLYALLNNYFEINLLSSVSKGSFVPPPKVESVVLSYKRIDDCSVPLDQYLRFESFLRKITRHRRKQIGSYLKQDFSLESLEKSFEMIDKDLRIRAEALTHEEIITLYKELCT